MRIKKLEIVGFKSFCDRTVLTFDQPVTGVVGPNGCGKSNIVDAIRWCMGEQSARHLRGKAMDDVIFGGSDTRGKSGMCEVSITFENDGRVPVDYLGYSEITVTRRLLRDTGQGPVSEYLLNRTPCRLRDVTDFFLGTGVGARAYSIIEQGRISLIVSSKPEDRRVLIEEAAGITKFKLKKKAAEKKMEFTRQNLLRVSDVVTEIEKQLGSLRRQAQKAERYKQYKAEVRDIELWSAAQRWLGHHAEERVAGAALAEAGAAREGAARELVAREASIEAARLASAEEARRIEAMQEALYELDNRIRLGEAQAEHEEQKARALEERVEQAGSEVELLGVQIARAEEELGRLAVESREAADGEAGHGGELAAAEEVVRGLKERLAAVQRAVDAAKGDMGRAQAEIARGESAERQLVRRIEDLELRLSRVGEEDARIKGRAGELGAQVAELDGLLAALREARTVIEVRTAERERRLGEVAAELARVDGELEAATLELHRKRSRHTSLHEIAERYEGFQRGTRAIMKKRDERWGVRGIVADVVRAPAEFEVAVEAALGERLGSIVVESHEAALDGIAYLGASREGRTSFVPLKARTDEQFAAEPVPEESGVRGRMMDLVECDDEYRPLARALLADVEIVDDLITAVDRWRAGTRHTLVTIEGEVLDRHGVVSGGAQGEKSAGVLHQKRELRQLQTIVAELQKSHDQAAARAADLKAERQAIQEELEELRRSAHAGEMELLTHDKDLARHHEELGRLAGRGQVLGGESADLAGQRDEAVLEAEEARLALRAARELSAAAEDRRDQHGREAVELIDDLDQASARLTELKVRAGQAEEKRRALARALAHTEAQQRDYQQRSARLLATISDGGSEAAGLRGTAAARRAELIDLSRESQERAAELSHARGGWEALREELGITEADIKRARAGLDAAAAVVTDLEIRLREARINRGHLEEHVADRYRIRVIDVLHDHHLRPPVGEAEERRLKELRDLIDRMGEINLTAIDEYQALEQRYQFLLAQRSDLEQALGQLEQAIEQINRTSKRRFREVFDLVNQKFQELFPRLFRGGHAQLVLTNEDDILESGIEIFATPPGKKNATVELLSGGEKALTAVSLVFAIFLIKPSPFCLLDEVDAPLDEANVSRFNDLLRAMTDRSQFIVITHNKRTMEVVDRLYGVTMEEPGVSKLVSVNLSQVGSQKAA